MKSIIKKDGTSYTDKFWYQNFVSLYRSFLGQNFIDMNFNDESSINFIILNSLGELGFDLNFIGTFYYMALVRDVMDELKDASVNKDNEKVRGVLSSLSNDSNHLYRKVDKIRKANNFNSDMFKQMIRSFGKIDEKKERKSEDRIIGDVFKETDYFKKSFAIACYSMEVFNEMKAKQKELNNKKVYSKKD